MWWKVLLLLTIGVVQSTLGGGGTNPRLGRKSTFQEDRIPFTDYVDDSSILPLVDPYDGISYRLPNTTVPIFYEIWISTAIDRGVFEFDGKVTIRIRCTETTPEIILHYRELTIFTAIVFDSNFNLIEDDVAWSQNETLEFLVISPNQLLVQGEEYYVVVNYGGTMTDNGLGIYQASYVDPDGNTRWLASTQFQATEARRAFPW